MEWANQTLQDRLIKEMRLREISDIEAANAFLPVFMADYNVRFPAELQSPVDAHQPLLHTSGELALILCQHHTRKLSKNLSLQFKNREYQLQNQGKGYRLRGATLTVCESFDGSITLLHKGHAMVYRLLAEGEPLSLSMMRSVHHTVEQAIHALAARPTYKPSPDHPWRRSTLSHKALPANT